MVFVREMDMPYGVRGFVAEDEDGNYNIYLNSRYCRESMLRTLEHEMTHIKYGDLDSTCLAHNIERAMK